MLKIDISFKIKELTFTFNEDIAMGSVFKFDVGVDYIAAKLFDVLTGLDDDYNGMIVDTDEVVNRSHSALNNVLALGNRTMFVRGSVRRNIYKALRARNKRAQAKVLTEELITTRGLLDIADTAVKSLSNADLLRVAVSRAHFRDVRLIVVNRCETYIAKTDEIQLPNSAVAYIIDIT